MASLYSETRKNGKAWRIGLSNGEERINISLGKMPKKTAELCLSMVEQIAATNVAGQSYSVEVATWTANINAKITDRATFERSVETVCQTYLSAFDNEAKGIHTVSVDEKTGIQALQRSAPTKPMEPGNDIALLGVKNVASGVPAPVGVPALLPAISAPQGNPAESGTFDVVLSYFGLPNDERFYPTLFPTLPSDFASVWEMIDNGAGYQQVIVAALLRCGYSGKRAWTIAENDKYAFDFYMDIKHCREMIYDYQRRRVSLVSMLGSVVVFCLKNLRRAFLGSTISREVLNISNLDKVAGAGLEPNLATLYIAHTYGDMMVPAVGKTVGNSEFSPDLRKIIRHWDTLPAEVKQTILTLIKRSQQRKTAKVF